MKKSILASILIALGDYVLLKQGQPLGVIFFSLGLYGVCMLDANLFTGKCGFIFENKQYLKLVGILAINMLCGFIIGLLMGLCDQSLVPVAFGKINALEPNISLLWQSMLCGMIMYIAVKCYKKGSMLGIFFGVPLFILSGFQHSVANVITMGVAGNLRLDILIICILGNFLGSILIWWLEKTS